MLTSKQPRAVKFSMEAVNWALQNVWQRILIDIYLPYDRFL